MLKWLNLLVNSAKLYGWHFMLTMTLSAMRIGRRAPECRRRGVEVEHGRRSERSVRNPDRPTIQTQMRWSIRVSSLLLAFGVGFAGLPDRARAMAQAPAAPSACEAQSAGGPL